jgi:hypothetical protein
MPTAYFFKMNFQKHPISQLVIFVVHIIDISNIDSMTFFRHKYNILISKGFLPVLQNELV